MRVITRAYGDEPLDRVTAGEVNGTVYVLNPRINRTLSELESSGVGFPSRYVYKYSESLLQELRGAWGSGDHVKLELLWARAVHASAKEAA